MFDDITPSTPSKLTDKERIETELLRYNHEEIQSYESDPLEWWKINSATYPNLSMKVKRMWTLPTSSVRSEEIFSTTGNIRTLKRNSLLPEYMDMLVFCMQMYTNLVHFFNMFNQLTTLH